MCRPPAQRPDRCEASGEVGPVVDEPGRHIGERRPVFDTPPGRPEPRDVDPTGRRDEDEARDAFRAFDRQARGEDSAHRLGDDVARSRGKLLDQPAEKVIERLDSRIAGDAVKPRIFEDLGSTEIGQPVGHRTPERRAPAGAGEEHERRPLHPPLLWRKNG